MFFVGKNFHNRFKLDCISEQSFWNSFQKIQAVFQSFQYLCRSSSATKQRFIQFDFLLRSAVFTNLCFICGIDLNSSIINPFINTAKTKIAALVLAEYGSFVSYNVFNSVYICVFFALEYCKRIHKNNLFQIVLWKSISN